MHRTSRVQEVAEQAKGKGGRVLEEAVHRITPYVEEAKTQASDKWIPAAEEAAKEARSRLEKDVVPAVSTWMAQVEEASEPYREEAMRRGTAAVAALRGDAVAVEPKKTHRLRKTLMLLGIAGAVAAAVKFVLGRQSQDDWQSDYTPTPPAAPAPVPESTERGDDAAAAAPGEAVADSTEDPHQPTDPDNPLTRKDV